MFQKIQILGGLNSEFPGALVSAVSTQAQGRREAFWTWLSGIRPPSTISSYMSLSTNEVSSAQWSGCGPRRFINLIQTLPEASHPAGLRSPSPFVVQRPLVSVSVTTTLCHLAPRSTGWIQKASVLLCLHLTVVFKSCQQLGIPPKIKPRDFCPVARTLSADLPSPVIPSSLTMFQYTGRLLPLDNKWLHSMLRLHQCSQGHPQDLPTFFYVSDSLPTLPLHTHTWHDIFYEHFCLSAYRSSLLHNMISNTRPVFVLQQCQAHSRH